MCSKSGPKALLLPLILLYWSPNLVLNEISLVGRADCFIIWKLNDYSIILVHWSPNMQAKMSQIKFSLKKIEFTAKFFEKLLCRVPHYMQN